MYVAILCDDVHQSLIVIQLVIVVEFDMPATMPEEHLHWIMLVETHADDGD